MSLVFPAAMQSKFILEGEWRTESKMGVYVTTYEGMYRHHVKYVSANNHAAATHEHQTVVWATGSGRKPEKRPAQIYRAAALAPLRALLKGDKAVGGTCVWWESQNPAGSLVSPSDALLGTPALFVELSVKQEVFTGTWASRLVVGTQARPKFSLFYWFIWSFFWYGYVVCVLYKTQWHVPHSNKV